MSVTDDVDILLQEALKEYIDATAEDEVYKLAFDKLINESVNLSKMTSKNKSKHGIPRTLK